MRFRTTLVDVSTLTRIIQTIHKVSPRMFVRLQPECIKFICTDDSAGVQIWSEIQIGAFCKDYKVQSNNENIINFEVSTDTLLQALRSAQNAVDVLLRLTKRDRDPLLSFAIANASHSGAKIEVVQDVVIKILSTVESARIKEPVCPDPDVHIFLPKLYNVRTVAERMKAVSSSIYLSANRNQEFRMSVEQPEIKMETTWKKCGHPHIDSMTSSAARADPARHWRVKVEAKSLLKFLSSHIVESRTAAMICSNHCVIFYVYVGERGGNANGTQGAAGIMTFFVPGYQEED